MTFNWGEFKAEIERLYMREGKSLEEVRDTLKAAHNFSPSVRAYKLKFGEWGYIKYNPRRMRTAEALISSRDLDLVQTTQAASSLLAESDSETVKQNLTQIENKLKRQASALNEQRIILGKVSRKRRRQHHESDTQELDNSLKSLTKHEASITQRRQNLDKLRTSISVQTSGPTGFASFWMQAPMVLEDAHGNVVPLPLELVISWEMLESILVSRFRTLPGGKKVQKREFELEDSLTKGTLSRKRPWAEFSRPGRKVDMSMTFKDASKTSVVCPKCDTISKEKKGVQVECSNPDCKMIFRTEDEEPDKISSPESRPRQVKRRRTVQPTTVDSPLEEEPEDHPATSRPLWQSLHASSIPTERYSTASSLTQPESMIRPEVSTTVNLMHMSDQLFGSSSPIHQPGVDGYQLQQNMWQGGFDPPIQGSQGDSRSDTLSNTSTQAIPTTMNVEDWSIDDLFQYFGIGGDLSDMSGCVPKTPNHPIDGSELLTQLPTPCSNCTFQNHLTLTSCEICGTDLPLTPGAHFRTTGLAPNTASGVTFGTVLSSGQIKRMESGNVSYSESNYEVFDPLNWMLDGLVDFPYSNLAINEHKTEESINSGQSSVDRQRPRSTTPTGTYLEVLSLSSSDDGWKTVDQFPIFEAYQQQRRNF